MQCVPRIIDPTELRVPPTTPIATIVAKPGYTTHFILHPPIAKGTQLVIESPAGLPLRELDFDEFGIASTALLPGPHRLHLVEYGRATDSVEVLVDSNPFLFEIHR